MNVTNQLMKMRKSFHKELTARFSVSITTRPNQTKKIVDVILSESDLKFIITYHKSVSDHRVLKNKKCEQSRIIKQLETNTKYNWH